MAYDGRVMRLALERFDEDRRARSEEQERGGSGCLAGSPCLREIGRRTAVDHEPDLAQALRQGTDPVPGGGAAAG